MKIMNKLINQALEMKLIHNKSSNLKFNINHQICIKQKIVSRVPKKIKISFK